MLCAPLRPLRRRAARLFDQLVDVVFPFPIEEGFTYRVRSGHDQPVGMLVEVPFHGRVEQAIVVRFHQNDPGIPLKEVGNSVFPEPVVNQAQIDLAFWMADEYLCGPGEALFKMFPAVCRPAKDNRRKKPPREVTLAVDGDGTGQTPLTLTEEQSAILSIIREELGGKRSSLHLLHGITGSGKTEIYIRALQSVVASGGGGILLVPEISLTVQTLRRLEEVFGGNLALLHSGRKKAERFADYLDVLAGRRRVVVGTRSAVFAPVANLALVILDEEHDGSYREHSTPRYDARGIARRRGESGAVVILGSATPRVDIRYAAERFDVRGPHASSIAGRRFFYHRLTRRASGALPRVTIVEREDYDAPISRSLLLEIEANFRSGHQTMLLLNRRGYQPYLICRSCRQTLQCPRCSVSLTLHKDGKLLCHQCGFTRSGAGACPSCGGSLRRAGTGVQKVEEHLLSLYPDMRIERLDTDTAQRGEGVDDVLGRFLSGEIDLLTGTQMIAKGLDSPRVTLVGVLQADLGLALPDFRASERVFSLLMQVAGRAGRGDAEGRVIFEATNPEHPILLLARGQDYDSFYREEIAERREHGYPPFRRLVRLLLRAREEEHALRYAEELARRLTDVFGEDAGVEILGPAPAPLARLQNRYRVHIILKVTDPARCRSVLRSVLPRFRDRLGEKAYLEIEFDPLDLL